MTAVAAFPNFDFALFENLCGLNVFQKRAVTLLVLFFDRRNKAEFFRKFGKALFFRGFRKTVVHIRPFKVFARRRCRKVLRGVAYSVKFFEPHFCVFFFVFRGFQKQRRNLLITLFFRF